MPLARRSSGRRGGVSGTGSMKAPDIEGLRGGDASGSVLCVRSGSHGGRAGYSIRLSI